MDDLSAPVKTQIRLPSGLHRKLTQAAGAAGRSFNAEMVIRLEQSFPASMSAEILATRENELARMKEHLKSLSGSIIMHELELQNPKLKGAMRSQVQESIQSIAREKFELEKLSRRIEAEIEDIRKSQTD